MSDFTINPVIDNFNIFDKNFYNIPNDGKCLFWGIFLSLKYNTDKLEIYDITNFIQFMELIDTLIDNSSNKDAYSLNNITVWGEDNNISDLVKLFGIRISVTFIDNDQIVTYLYEKNPSDYRIDLLLYNSHFYLVINPENLNAIRSELKHNIENIKENNLMNLGDTYEKYDRIIKRIETGNEPLSFSEIIQFGDKPKFSDSGAAAQHPTDTDSDRFIAELLQKQINSDYHKKYLKYKKKYLKLKNELNRN